MMKPIYLDYAATTPLDPAVIKSMQTCLAIDGLFANPASKHSMGQAARLAIETAREQVAACIRATPEEIIWTSGATESINLALKGTIRLYHQRKGKHIVTMKTEHKAVLDVCQYLEKEGFQVTYLSPMTNGLLDLDAFLAALRPDTVMASIMHVNNETGVIQNIESIAKITAERGIFLHVDAAQSIGKVNLDMQKIPVDLLSLGSHKAYGPKGIGALYLRKKPRIRVEPIIHGGGHELGLRSGTLATHQIVGMGVAYELAQQLMLQDYFRISQLRDQLINGLSSIENFKLNMDLKYCVPHIINIRFTGMISAAILADLPQIAASTASACRGKGSEGSYVLRALGLSDAEAKSSIRFSLGRYTTSDEINQVISLFRSRWQ